MPIDPPERVPTPDWAPRLGIATRGQTHWPQESFGNPLLKADRTLVEQLVNWLSRRIDERVFPKGARLPSIRTMALTQGVSRSTVVAAYERMVALGVWILALSCAAAAWSPRIARAVGAFLRKNH